MITHLPAFLENEQYRQNRGGRYRFTLLEDVTIRIDCPLAGSLGNPILFYDKDGVVWAKWDKGFFTIKKNYSWDGCSPKKRFAMLWLGTPDPHCTRLGSLVHDALYQFIATDHFPWSRAQCDACFYDCMKLSGFLMAGTFHGAVRIFGGLYVANQTATGAWSKELKPTLKSPRNQDEAA